MKNFLQKICIIIITILLITFNISCGNDDDTSPGSNTTTTATTLSDEEARNCENAAYDFYIENFTMQLDKSPGCVIGKWTYPKDKGAKELSYIVFTFRNDRYPESVKDGIELLTLKIKVSPKEIQEENSTKYYTVYEPDANSFHLCRHFDKVQDLYITAFPANSEGKYGCSVKSKNVIKIDEISLPEDLKDILYEGGTNFTWSIDEFKNGIDTKKYDGIKIFRKAGKCDENDKGTLISTHNNTGYSDNILSKPNFNMNKITGMSFSDTYEINNGNEYCYTFCTHKDNVLSKGVSFNAKSYNIKKIADNVENPNVIAKIDSNDKIHVVYANTQNKLNYVTCENDKWSSEEVICTMYKQYFSFDVGTSNIPHVVYFDNVSKKLKHAYKNGASWNSEIIEGGSGESNDKTSMSICTFDDKISVFL